MSLRNLVKEQRDKEVLKPVTNFMDGTSYEINPIDTLKMVTASSIFGEPSYYRDGIVKDAYVKEVNKLLKPYAVFNFGGDNKKTSELMEEVIDAALAYDFKATLEWAVTLRHEFNMRLNPQIIMVRAAVHPNRLEFTANNPGLFAEINNKVMSRADEPGSQLMYYLYMNKGKRNLPNILKKNWKHKIESLSRYQLAKYKSSNVGIIDVVRLSHAKGPLVDELMTTGTIKVSDDTTTWERLRSDGKSWKEILETITLGHMALLRNLRNIFTEINDINLADSLLAQLKDGVLKGKQFPFRYYTAYKMIEQSVSLNHKSKILDALEECMDIALENMPELKGKTLALSDNSGSAWGTIPTEYGSVKVAEIDNLSSVIIAKKSEEGTVGVFGDRLDEVTIGKRNGVLADTRLLGEKGEKVGYSTENGIWLALDKAIKTKEHIDNIFIFSDMQAGHGGLFGINVDKEYRVNDKTYYNDNYIDVAKMISIYRNKVNPKVNVFMVQTAGYDNVLIPEYTYRGNVLYGWTGKEAIFAKTIIDQWDAIDARKN